MTFKTRLKQSALGIALAAMASITQNAVAQAFPAKPVKLVIPLTAGSGAGGLVGTGVVAQAPADGCTLMVQSASYSANPALYKKLPYDVNKPLTMAGRTAFYMAPLDASIGHVKGGRLKALGVTTSARAEAASDIPTLAEQGQPGFDLSLWFGLWALPEMPAALTQQINADLTKALAEPEVMAAFAKSGIAIKKMRPAEFSGFVKDEAAKFSKIARDAKLEQQ